MQISIITVNLNNKDGLRKTIESVVAQTSPPDEFIVIDGASTDGSPSLLQDYAAHISCGISEPDKGIYNAMNKGIRIARGEYCLFLNSGDTLCDGRVLEHIREYDSHADIICGNAIILETPTRRKKAPSEVTLRLLYNTTFCHQAVFIKTDMLRKHFYDESLRIVADRKFFLQALVFDGCSYQAVDLDICDYDVTGFSAGNRFASEQEWKAVLQELVPLRILLDYGREMDGVLFGTTAYERLFLEIGRRNWRKPVYRLVRCLLSLAAVMVPAARFVKALPKEPI